jgi:hypothetical protein
MVDETRAGPFATGTEAGPAAPENPSRSASLGTLACVLVILIGIAGQVMVGTAVAWAVIVAFGLGALASIVLAHQR